MLAGAAEVGSASFLMLKNLFSFIHITVIVGDKRYNENVQKAVDEIEEGWVQARVERRTVHSGS